MFSSFVSDCAVIMTQFVLRWARSFDIRANLFKVLLTFDVRKIFVYGWRWWEWAWCEWSAIIMEQNSGNFLWFKLHASLHEKSQERLQITLNISHVLHHQHKSTWRALQFVLVYCALLPNIGIYDVFFLTIQWKEQQALWWFSSYSSIERFEAFIGMKRRRTIFNISWSSLKKARERMMWRVFMWCGNLRKPIEKKFWASEKL